MVIQEQIHIRTQGRGSEEITQRVAKLVQGSAINTGLCNIFIQHTSASLILCENADPVVHRDLETFMSKTVTDGDPMFHHTAEGPDDMPAHIRTVLTDSSLTLPIKDGVCLLGTWQGIYLWEHRTQGHQRKIIVTLYGE